MNTIASLFGYKTWADAELFGLLKKVATQLPPDTPALPPSRAAVAETNTWFERHAVAATPSTLQQTISFTFTNGGAGRMSREETLLHVVTHGGYRRGNVGQMLQGARIGAPRDLYTRFLHGDQPSRRAAA